MRNREINFNTSVKMNWGNSFCHCSITAGSVTGETLRLKQMYTKTLLTGSINYFKIITYLGSISDLLKGTLGMTIVI